jgi:hypothetical protein
MVNQGRNEQKEDAAMREIPLFIVTALISSSPTLSMAVACCSERLVPIYQTARFHNAGDTEFRRGQNLEYYFCNVRCNYVLVFLVIYSGVALQFLFYRISTRSVLQSFPVSVNVHEFSADRASVDTGKGGGR